MIKIFKFFLILTYILIFQSCNTVKEGFRSQKKNSTDEFLVEKKSPLVMPPEFSELPTPKISESVESDTSNDIKFFKQEFLYWFFISSFNLFFR
jgi:hypothetical protein